MITPAGPAAHDIGPGGEPVIDARGTSVVPLLDGNALRARPAGEHGAYHLVPGDPATFAVVRGRVNESRMRNMPVVRPADLLAVAVDGEILVRNGEPYPATGVPDPDAWIGARTDRGRALDQTCSPAAGTPRRAAAGVDACTGAWWTRGGRIVYRDDSGFWAFGVQYDGVIRHAGIVRRR
ncbi:Atu4866 domain-containing protein [Pseudonocardia sp. NPDC046786]|uniref:Atu4866 domain-containing protein n=1 Tax=Pseudonocardia sp. NPDC046786 TaxID=3155471 RepID=UPI0033EF4026